MHVYASSKTSLHMLAHDFCIYVKTPEAFAKGAVTCIRPNEDFT